LNQLLGDARVKEQFLGEAALCVEPR